MCLRLLSKLHVSRIWIVGAWPRPKSMQRTLRWDGLLPTVMDDQGNYARATPQDVSQMKAYIGENRQAQTPFDIVVEGKTPGDDIQQAASIVRPFAEAGATWWLDAMWDPTGLDPVLARIRQGPPRLYIRVGLHMQISQIWYRPWICPAENAKFRHLCFGLWQPIHNVMEGLFLLSCV